MDYKALGVRIRAERKKMNMTQEKMASMINISTAYMGQIERGVRNAPLDVLVNIANALGVTIDYLLEDSYSSLSEIPDGQLRIEYSLFQLLSDRDERDIRTALSMLKELFRCLDEYKKRPLSNGAPTNGCTK